MAGPNQKIMYEDFVDPMVQQRPASVSSFFSDPRTKSFRGRRDGVDDVLDLIRGSSFAGNGQFQRGNVRLSNNGSGVGISGNRDGLGNFNMQNVSAFTPMLDGSVSMNYKPQQWRGLGRDYSPQQYAGAQYRGRF